MEFWIGKIAMGLFAPANLLIILLMLSLIMPMRPWLRSFLCTGIGFFLFACLILPIGDWAMVPLEQCARKIELPAKIDGIIALGGAVNEDVTNAQGDVEFNSMVDRIIAMLRLMKKYPDATIIYSGGSGDPNVPKFNEADYIKKTIADIGLDPARVIAENASRNTSDNVKFTQSYFSHTPDQNWLIVTSAFHMPRALPLFQKAGEASRTHFYAYPADFKTSGRIELKLSFDLARNLKKLNTAAKEYFGLAVNRLLKRTDRFMVCGTEQKETHP